MNIGMIGLGKLGLPVATTIAMQGHKVVGYDVNPVRMTKQPQKYQEAGPDGTGEFNDFLARADNLSFGSIEDVCNHADIIFVAVQTPHSPKYEGITRIPDERVDFDYSYLAGAVRQLADYVRPGTIVTIISTCLPGTMRRDILPLLPEGVHFVYNPFFIAMGTVMRDFLFPEFILVGSDDFDAAKRIETFYRTVCEAHCEFMSIESAELTKVAYNTFISFKICYANLLMEICHKMPHADVDDVTQALKKAYRRLISPAYLSGGMGDGGACHPRDNIAMSWLAQHLGLRFDLFEAIMKCREEQAAWLADLVIEESRKARLPIVIYGYAFKADTNIVTGSAAVLTKNIIAESEKVEMLDPVIDGPDGVVHSYDDPAVFLIGCPHTGIENSVFPEESVIIDPHRIIPEVDGIIKVISLGLGDLF